MEKIIEMIKTNKKVQIALVVIIVAIVAIIVVSLVGGAVNTVKLKDYVEFSEVKGCDGYGYIEYEIDAKGLSKALLEDEDDIDDDLYDLLKAGFIGEFVEVDIEDNGELSNGDKIEIVVTIDDDYDFDKKIVEYTFTKKISGLGKVKTLNLFKDFSEIKFVGKNGEGSVEFVNKENYKDKILADLQSEINYYVETEGKFTNGQKVTITASVDDIEEFNKELMKKGYKVLEEQTMEFTVKNLWEPITRDQLTDDMLEAIEQYLSKKGHVASIEKVYYFWGDVVEGAKLTNKNAVIVYMNYVDVKNEYKGAFYSFWDLHKVTEEGEQPFSRDLIHVESTFSKPEKVTQQKALETVTRYLGKAYDISFIK